MDFLSNLLGASASPTTAAAQDPWAQWTDLLPHAEGGGGGTGIAPIDATLRAFQHFTELPETSELTPDVTDKIKDAR